MTPVHDQPSFPGWRSVCTLRQQRGVFVIRKCGSRFIPSKNIVGRLNRILQATLTRGEGVVRSRRGTRSPVPIGGAKNDQYETTRVAGAGGDTLVFNQLFTNSFSLLSAQFALSKRLGQSVQSSAFLVKGSAPGFYPHYDEVDLFVVQIRGAKLWKIYEQIAKPPAQSQVIRRPHRKATNIILRSGDVLYVPRGTVHEASNYLAGAWSLHVTLALIPRV